MFYIKMKPRAYRLRAVVITKGGYPANKWLLQAQTRFGWNTLWNFDDEASAIKAHKEWEATLP